VLRQQNVESRVLARLAAVLAPPLRPLLRWQAARLRRAEASGCRAADVVAAISEPDAALLRELAPAARVAVLPAAYARRGRGSASLAGSPPLLCLGSFDWWPTRDGGRWLLRDVWPRLRRLLPGAVLHLAGPGSGRLARPVPPGVVVHGALPDSRTVLDPGAIALVPLRAGSGVRLRILEAWDAGLPVVTTPVGGEGLVATDGDGAMVAADAAEFAAPAARVAGDGELRQRLAAPGEERLAAHAPQRVAAVARALYTMAVAAAGERADGLASAARGTRP
jgi:glycosyltransferase involved in cell wall biosynthesis